MADSDAQFQSLVDRLHEGDPRAAMDFVRIYEPLVRRAVKAGLQQSRLRHAFDSIDFCQSVFGVFLRQLMDGASVESPTHLANLLSLIAKRKLSTALRREYQHRRFVEQNLAHRSVSNLIDPEPTPSLQAATRELIEKVQQELTPIEREIAGLRAAGQSWEEVAKVVGGTPQSCRVRLLRAIRRVDEELRILGHDN